MITSIEKVSEWTHEEVELLDIRKNDKMHILHLNIPEIDNPVVTINNDIIIDQLNTYFITGLDLVTRNDIMELKWNLVLTKGYYVKLLKGGEAEKQYKNPNKWYVSFIKVSGSLGTFGTIYK